MENFASMLAINHNVSKGSSKKTFPIASLKDDYSVISRAFDILSESVSKSVSISPSGEWLLDNFYIIEEQYHSILEGLSLKEYQKLPSVEGKSRILILATELVKYTDGKINEDVIEKFILGYQTKRNIELDEINYFPLMIKIALIHHIKLVADRMIIDQLEKFKVESLIERIIEVKDITLQKFKEYKNISLNGEVMTYIEYLIYSLKKLGKDKEAFLNILEEEIVKKGTTSTEIIRTLHFDMAVRRISISNSILSIKNISRYNWEMIFEKINNIENLLLKDATYPKMDFYTKTRYREEIKKIAKIANVSEVYVTKILLELSQKKQKHIGFFLFDEERKNLSEALECKKIYKTPLSNDVKLLLYLLSIYVPSLIVSMILLRKYFLLGILPFSEVFVLLINRGMMKIQKPKRLFQMEEIDQDINTFVIVPTLLSSKERIEHLISDIEVYYLANKEAKLKFCLLGDASESDREICDFDEEIKLTGISEVNRLNAKYGNEIFYFIYRKRVFNQSQGKWLGYERKRGMITEFNHFLMTGDQGTFLVNTIQEIPKTKYIITIDADTNLILDSAKKLIGIMEHPLNHPVIQNGIVVKGYGLIQPKIGVPIHVSTASLFAKLFSGNGGLDMYSGAESNIYQDIFGEAIFTGKGIFHVEVYEELLKNEIPENKVLSHDLLEGSYLRVGLASHITLMDGFPSRVNSYLYRLKRWTRGDFQILGYLFSKKLNNVSKYKIFDNLRRGVLDISLLVLLFFGFLKEAILISFFPFLLDVCGLLFHFRNEMKKSKNFFMTMNGTLASFYRCAFGMMILPHRALLLLEAIVVTLYRMMISKRNLLEWTTAADSEKILGVNFYSYFKDMIPAVVLSVILFANMTIFFQKSILVTLPIFLAWLFSPYISYYFSKPTQKRQIIVKNSEKEILLDIAKRTWSFFDRFTNQENNYLMPDNYQEKRKRVITKNTSSTNIGLGLLAIISAKDLGLIDSTKMLNKLKDSIETIENLEKWNGHLYNWYDVTTKEPLEPRFVSTVDSGNFVGYLYVVKKVFEENEEWPYAKKVQKLIEDTAFGVLYDDSKNLFSIGYDGKEKKIVDSYYDLLASEARGASFVAIAKRDIPYKHWFNLGRSFTTMDGYKGLVSWAGTMFEYFMPRIVMKPYDYTLLAETYQFCVYSQKKYARELGIPWGISESAFNLQDFNYHYQYKAFGIPWLGLKRGLKEEVVVSPYSCLLALCEAPKEVLKNIEKLKKVGAYDKFGFYESIDYTPSRVKNKYEVVKTYMAHHQALILLSINNFLNHDILADRFMRNPEIKSAEILLEERIPERVIFTKEKKEKAKFFKYQDYEDYIEKVIHKPEKNVNILSGESLTLLIDDEGNGYAETDGNLIYPYSDYTKLSSTIFIKDKQSKEYFSNTLKPVEKVPEEYQVSFSPAFCKFYRRDDNLETTTKIIVSSEDRVILKQLEITNDRKEEAFLDIISYEEPILSSKESEIAHPAYQSLFLCAEELAGNALIKKRFSHGEMIYYMNFAVIPENLNAKFEIELDKLKIVGRGRTLKNPIAVEQDKMFSNQVSSSVNTAIALKKEIRINPNEKVTVHFFTMIANSVEEMKGLYEKYHQFDVANRMQELAVSRTQIENRFLGLKGKEIIRFHEILSEVMNGSRSREKYRDRIEKNHLKQSNLWKFGISGDLPIILVRIENINDAFILNEYIRAIVYFHHKKMKIDLLILNGEKNSYEQYNRDKIYEILNKENANDLLNMNGGIHILKEILMTDDEINLIYACSDVIVSGTT